MERVAALLIVVVVASCATGLGSHDYNVHFKQSVRTEGDTTLLLSPTSETGRWPAREETRLTALWKSIAAEKCGSKHVVISDGPFAIQLLDHCEPYPGTTDCGLVSVSGDFSCGM